MRDRLAIFDMDGTLIDTCRVNFMSYRKALSEEGIDLTEEYFNKECFGKGYKDYLPPLVNGDADMMERVHKRKAALYDDYLGEAKVNPALEHFIRGMKDMYYMALVTTASRENVYGITEHFGLKDEFDLILTAAEIPKLKPDAEGFLMAMRHFNIPPERTVIFEDSEVGTEAAMRSGAAVMRVERICGIPASLH